ncbi:cell shape-determining protein MreC [Vibrio cholerae]|nr:cell shape-determining protein MreC [Vibrio cholerae]MBD1178370.1 cell shape-determining protein MreC [Vibrio cholerae]
MVSSFGTQLHSFWRWTCVCMMPLRKMHFKQRCLTLLGNNRLRS